MGTLIRFNRTLPLFERSIESILNDGFFNSFDTNLQDLGDKYVVQVAVPGMSKEHLNIQLNGNVLRIQGEKQWKNGMPVQQVVEFSNTRYSRSFILPEDTDHDAISAECKNGLLTLHLGKHVNGRRTTQIQIKDAQEDTGSWWQKFKNFLKRKR